MGIAEFGTAVLEAFSEKRLSLIKLALILECPCQVVHCCQCIMTGDAVLGLTSCQTISVPCTRSKLHVKRFEEEQKPPSYRHSVQDLAERQVQVERWY